MPRQNRVTPLGELIAADARGTVYGNRGCLHDDAGRIRRHHVGKRWIACLLEFRGRRRTLLQPGRYTELFFLDEATAFAAGHRPCAECRRSDYDRLLARWWREPGSGRVGAGDVDARLHSERLLPDGRARRLHVASLATLPDGAFVLVEGTPCLVLGDRLLTWSPWGYTTPRPRPVDGAVELLTPPSLVSLLHTDWQPLVPLLHPSALEVR